MFGNIPTDSYTNNQTNFEISKLFTNLYKEKRDKHNFIFSEYMSLHQYVKYIDWYEIFFDPLFSYQLYEYIVVHSLAYAILSKYILISNYRSEKICVFIIENEKMPYYKLLEYAEPLAQRKGPKNEIFKSIFKLYSDSLTIEFLDLCLTHDIVLNCFNVMHDSFIEYYFKNNDCTTEELIEIIDRNNLDRNKLDKNCFTNLFSKYKNKGKDKDVAYFWNCIAKYQKLDEKFVKQYKNNFSRRIP